MIERSTRKPYWRETKALATASLLLPVAAVLTMPLWIGWASQWTLIGLPLGFVLAVHGLVLLAVAAAARFVGRQDEIDQWHGAHDEG